jgi:hypothetical protein
LDKPDERTNIRAVTRSPLGPAGLALAAALTLCVVAPPEIIGSSYAAVAILIAAAAVATSADAVSRPGSWWVFAGIPLALVATRTAIAPGEAVEPVVSLLLAALAGFAAAGASVRDEILAPLLAALVAFAGCRALYETWWGLPSWAARVRESAPTGDTALAVLSRLEQGRPYGGFLTPAALGCFLILTIPAVTAWAFGKRGGLRALGLGAAALGTSGLVATRSLSALGALGCAIALAALRRRVAPRALAAAAGAIGLVVLGAGLIRPDAVFSPTREDSPWRLRAGNVRVALEIARDHPLAGVGPGGYAEAFPQYRRAGDNESRHAHDLPAELAAEWGIPVGFALSAVFFVVFMGPVARGAGAPRTLAFGSAVGLAAFAIHNLADFTAFLPSLLIFAAVLRGRLVTTVPFDRPRPAMVTAWIALASLIAVLAASSGLARDALFDARTAAADGDHAGALRLAERAGKIAPWDADPPQLAASARMAAGPDIAAALADAERAVTRAPSRAAARAVRARARSAAGDSAGAYADLAEAARLYPLNADYAKQRDALADALNSAAAAAPR